jgi:hypothetical protein
LATLTALTDFAGVDAFPYFFTEDVALVRTLVDALVRALVDGFPDFITEDVALVRALGGLSVADLLLLF